MHKQQACSVVLHFQHFRELFPQELQVCVNSLCEWHYVGGVARIVVIYTCIQFVDYISKTIPVTISLIHVCGLTMDFYVFMVG